MPAFGGGLSLSAAPNPGRDQVYAAFNLTAYGPASLTLYTLS